MEALDVRPLEQDGGMMEEEGMEASPQPSNSEEESDEDSEAEPPLVVRRKVSFADAFGFNLVSVKEFDNIEAGESEVSRSDEREVTLSLEEFHMSCLFTVPSSPEELDERLQTQMVELESIELLPGTTTLRAIVRVVNLCFSKCVYARFTLDRWSSYFDLLAEYVPGSSDRKTDRFSFQYTVVPPFERDGTRVEFCLRYETSLGTFWANNKRMNYVLFFHQKGHVKEIQVQEESSSYKSKRSCLKTNRNGGADERNWETINTPYSGGLDVIHKAEKADRKAMKGASASHNDDHKYLVESVRSRHKATRLARVQDYFSQRRHQVPAYPHDSADGQKAPQPLAAPWGASASYLHECQKTQVSESPQVLTYHQIPLLTLDWNNEKLQQCGAADVADIWAGKAKMTLSNTSEENTPSVNDMWGAFLNGADDSTDKETSVCDVWQAFLNGPSCEDHSAVPESEWLQTATSVSPSNDKDLHSQYAASSQDFPGFQGGAETPTTLHTFAACQPLSESHGTELANHVLNEDHQPAEACVSGPRDDNTATQAASQRSQTNSVTDTAQEFSLEGAPPVSEETVDCSVECHTHAEREGIIGGAEGKGGGGPFTWHTADLVTSSGESETTDMTAMPESQNANVVDRISQGARLHEGLSSSGEGEVTGSAHNTLDDTLAFRETIRQGTKDGARGEEEETATENQVDSEDVVSRPRKTKECQISPRYADEMRCEKSVQNPNSENPLQESEKDENEMRSAQLDTGGFEQDQTSRGNSELNKTMATELEEGFSSNDQDVEIMEKTEEESSICMVKEEMSVVRKDLETMQVSDEIDSLQEVIFEANDADEELSVLIRTEEVVHPRYEPDDKRMNLSPTRHNPKDEPKPLEVVEPRWNHLQKDVSQTEDKGSEIRPGKVPNNCIMRKNTSREHERKVEDVSRKVESVGKLKIDTMRALMGNVKDPRGGRANAPAGLKEHELPGQDESPQHVEYKRPPNGTKDPIRAENTTSLEEMGTGLEERFMERFAEDLIVGIWKEVFGQEEQASNRDANIVEGMDNSSAVAAQNCRLLFGNDVDDTCDSGVFSLMEFPVESHESEPTLTAKSNQTSSKDTIESTGKTSIFAELQTDFNSSAHPSQDLTATSAPRSKRLLTESSLACSSSLDQENNCPQMQQRLVSCPELDITHEETVNRFIQPSHRHQKSKEADEFSWWRILYIVFHITRLLICIVLVGGFFAFVFLYDFPAFFGLYVFSSCWWFYKWRRHRGTTKNRMVG